MRLYHFTAERFVESILRDGLTRGAVLVRWSHPIIEMAKGYQWLTVCGEWRSQTWCEGTGTLPYRRDEVRMTVDVPDGDPNVLRWIEVGSKLSREWRTLNSYGDPWNWRLYRGDVPASWIKSVDRKLVEATA